MSKKKKNPRTQWSDFTLDEQFTIISLIFCIVFLVQHYILAYLGKDTMIELAITIVTAMIVILVKYAIKSFKGKKEEENLKFKKQKFNIIEEESDIIDNVDDFDDSFFDIKEE